MLLVFSAFPVSLGDDSLDSPKSPNPFLNRSATELLFSLPELESLDSEVRENPSFLGFEFEVLLRAEEPDELFELLAVLSCLLVPLEPEVLFRGAGLLGAAFFAGAFFLGAVFLETAMGTPR